MHCRSITAEFLIPPIVHVVKVMILFHTKSTEGGGGGNSHGHHYFHNLLINVGALLSV